MVNSGSICMSKRKKVAHCLNVLTLELMLFHQIQVPKGGGSKKIAEIRLVYFAIPPIERVYNFAPPNKYHDVSPANMRPLLEQYICLKER